MNVFQASRQNDLATLRQLLEDQPELVHARETSSQWTALHHATAGGSLKAARLLLSLEADCNAQGLVGETSLHLALQRDLAELLIEHGANPLIQDNDGLTPLDLALEDRNEELYLVMAAGAPDRGSPTYQFLKAARHLELQVTARYHDHFHTFQIHGLGWKDEVEHCQAYQLGGSPGWQCLPIEDLSDLYFGEPVSTQSVEEAPGCLDVVDDSSTCRP